jgi:uncharacterized protein (DUF58 family)
MTYAPLVNAMIARLRLERFVHGEGPQTTPITLDRHRIFILPTREGVLFAGVIGIVLIGATNYHNSMGFLLSFLLTGLGLVSILHTYRNMVRLTFRAGYGTPVFAGEAAPYTVFVDNPSGAPRFALTLVLDGGVPAHVDIPAQDVTRVVVTRPATTRGYLPMGRCTVSTRFPIGLFRAWAYIDLGIQCLVYPAPASPRPLPPLHRNDQSGGETSGQGVADFTGLRQYVPGDSPRHIAWKRAAHNGELLTKQFAGVGTGQRWLTWDDAGSVDLEARLALLCRWVLSAHAEGAPYGLRLPTQDILPAHTPAQRDACLKALALYGTES